ncbi:MAG: 1-deoxy-D-xylulose-5-phosphate synthase [Lachnospiraceae bacterium]|jgi:1-deoxy-D-xylulose-5-phosphate synthase|nr:1-deoxy-D-xylulose-5-phosphate synthase [Lachnospiraceae bacterium]
MILEKINTPNDIKKLSPEELPVLATEIREFLIENLSVTGGHLASNLGSVELTIALHLIMDFPEDKLIFDVGHQSYTHKILTGRKGDFKTLRSYGGLSGFPSISESKSDAFGTGHASTSISAGLGMAYARDITGADYKVVSVIGDGALTGGLALEGINNSSALKSNLTIILNDNKMSISPNVGGMSQELSKLRTSPKYTDLKYDITASLEKIPVYGEKLVANIRRTKNGMKQLFVPGMLFEEMGIMYLGPVDGHDVNAMVRMFRRALSYKGVVLVHVVTHKGKGYAPAEKHPARFHGTAPFDLETGIPKKKCQPGYTDIFSTVMKKMGQRDDKVVAITAAMEDGTGLRRFHNSFPERFFDVGIAEEHAVTFAAGLATQGLKPVFAVYSTFLQRAYDELLHDVCLQNLHVIFAIDRAGIVGTDGATHQGIFDLSYLLTIPNLTVMAPKNKWELSDMVKLALSMNGPVAIRYPKGNAYQGLKEYREPLRLGKSEEIYSGHSVLLYAIGSMVSVAEEARNLLLEKGLSVTLCNARFAMPLDRHYLIDAKNKYNLIVTLEENVLSGGFGEHVTEFLIQDKYKGEIMNISIPTEYVTHGNRDLLLSRLGLDAVSVADRVYRAYKKTIE